MLVYLHTKATKDLRAHFARHFESVHLLFRVKPFLKSCILQQASSPIIFMQAAEVKQDHVRFEGWYAKGLREWRRQRSFRA